MGKKKGFLFCDKAHRLRHPTDRHVVFGRLTDALSNGRGTELCITEMDDDPGSGKACLLSISGRYFASIDATDLLYRFAVDRVLEWVVESRVHFSDKLYHMIVDHLDNVVDGNIQIMADVTVSHLKRIDGFEHCVANLLLGKLEGARFCSAVNISIDQLATQTALKANGLCNYNDCGDNFIKIYHDVWRQSNLRLTNMVREETEWEIHHD